jgi:hypothetical protein
MAALVASSAAGRSTDGRVFRQIVFGPDKWNLVIGLCEAPGFGPDRRRLDFAVEDETGVIVSYPVRLDAVERLDDAAEEWMLSGHIDRAADFDNYDNDGCQRAISGRYNTTQRRGSLNFA